MALQRRQNRPRPLYGNSFIGVYTKGVETPQPNSSPRPNGPALRFVAAALIVRGGEVLIGQRRVDQPMASLWSFPRKDRSGRKPRTGAGRANWVRNLASRHPLDRP